MMKIKKVAKSSMNVMHEEEFSPWLDQHIKAMDTPLADYLVSIGL